MSVDKSKVDLLKEIEQLKQIIDAKDNRIKEIEGSCELNQIFDTVGNGVRIIDKDFNNMRINKTFSDMTKLSSNEILKKKCYDVFKSHCCHSPECPLARILNGETLIECEVNKEAADGEKVDCLLTAKPLYGKNGEIIGIVEDFRDISSIKKSERALRESEAKFRSYMDKCPDGMFVVDKKGNYLQVNPAGCQLVGYTEEELKQMTVSDLNSRESSHFRYLHEYGISIGEVHLIKKDGNEITVDLHAVDLGNGQYIGFNRDVSDRKRMEEALKESEIQHNLILQGISDLVILYGVESESDFRVLKINNSCLKYLGLKREQVYGKLIQEVLPAELAIQLIESDRKAVQARVPILAKEVNYPFGCFNTNYIPVLNEEGKCTHLLVTARDISSEKEIEEHALKIEKLESVGLLAGGIAHDFNNILTVVTGNISLAKLKLAKQNESSQISELLTEVEKASLQARNLTQQLLTFAKGGAPILKTSSIGEVLKESIGFSLSGSNVRCDFSIDTGLWPVEIDEGQISQVINNLIINADHAMPEGGIIEVKAENIVISGKEPVPIDAGNFVKISIADYGIGIPREYLTKVFDPYFTTKQKGNGLGLTTAHSIVWKHKGRLLVESKLGEGTVFYIYLPASKSEVFERDMPKLEILGGKGKVLVMDDEKMIRMVLKDMLNHMGYEVRCVKDGQEALKEYKHNHGRDKPFDIVIMDLTIPGGKGGKETIKELLKLDPKAKAIVASGYSNDTVMSNYKKYGFKGIITKPFNVAELNEVLRNVLEDKALIQMA